MQQDFQLELDGESSEPDEAHDDNFQVQKDIAAKPVAVSAQAQYEEPSVAYNNASDTHNKILDLKVGKLDYSVKKETGISTRATNARM